MKNPYLFLFLTAWKYSEGRRGLFVLTYVLFATANLISMVEPLVLAQLVNIIQANEGNLLRMVVLYLGLHFSLTLFFWLFHGPARIVERTTAFYIRKNFTDKLFQTVTVLPVSWHKDHHSGETYDKIYKAQGALDNFADGSFDYVGTLLKLLFSVIAILWFVPVYGFFALLIGILIFVISAQFDRYLVRYRIALNKIGHTIASGLFDYISNIRTVITLRLERRVQKEVSRRIGHLLPVFDKSNKLNEWKWFIHSILMGLLFFFVLLAYIYQQITSGQALLVGSIIALFQYVERLSGAFFGLGWQWEALTLASTDIMSAETILCDYERMTRKNSKKPLPKDWKMIEISKLSFRYEDYRHRVAHLDDLDLTLERGKRIALVGESGSGKSTLMAILRGLDIPQSSYVIVDGEPYNSLSVLAQTTTLFPQDPEIFENSIEYNISLGLGHKRSEVKKAAKLAEFSKVLKRLPKGLESNIKEKGVNLSGGEKQRLALARGIFAAQDSSIILLDEPTSSVDSTNEMKIYRNLFKTFRRQCIVSSIHRLHLLPLFDRIYVLEKGKIVEEGTFKELRDKKGGKLQAKWEEYSKHLSHGE